jgi:Mn-dependent DtxR family transcriptional regulator
MRASATSRRTLGVSKSGVTSMLRSLQTRGLISHEKYGCVELTRERLAARGADRVESPSSSRAS